MRVIGERINPTGKKRFQQALREADIDYIVARGIEQQDAGAEILDVNVGLPGIDEPAMMRRVVKALQAVVDLPLQIDSSDPAAIEAGLRAVNGKAIVNSVNGKREVLEASCRCAKSTARRWWACAWTRTASRRTGRAAAHRPPDPGRGALFRDPQRGRADRLPDAHGLRPAGAGGGDPAGGALGEGGAGPAHRAGREQHLLRPARARAHHRELSDPGPAGRAGFPHRQPEQRGRHGRGGLLPGALRAGPGRGGLHPPLCQRPPRSAPDSGRPGA